MSLKWNAFDQLPGDQCSQGIALHTARPLKNGGALPIFYQTRATWPVIRVI